ncbi:MAG: hypothetical protein ACRCVI_02575 [Mycoplasmoidaceae bacterium]
MNKRLKISILSTLLFGISLSMIYPIVSCSDNSIKLKIDKQVDNPQLIREFGTALAKAGNSSLTNNLSVLTEAEFKNVVRNYSNQDTEVWNKAKAFFVIKDDNNNDIFDQTINSVRVSGTYDGESASQTLNVSIKLETKSGYSAPSSNASHSPIQVGISAAVNLSFGKNSNLESSVGFEIAKLANPDVTGNESVITKAQFDPIVNKTYGVSDNVALYNALNKYLVIKRASGTAATLATVANSYKIEGSYPVVDEPQDILVTLTFNLKDGFVVSDENFLVFSFKIGESKQTLVIQKGDEAALNKLATEIAKVGKKTATSNTEFLTNSQWSFITNETYSQTRTPEVWTALNEYYTFTKTSNNQIVSFTHVVQTVTVTEIGYPLTARDAIKVKVNVTLKPEYTIDDPSLLQIPEIQIGIAYEPVSYTYSPTSELFNSLGVKFAQVAVPAITDTEQTLSREQYDLIAAENYSLAAHPGIWQDLSRMIRVTSISNSTALNFNDVIDRVVVIKEAYPTAINAQIHLQVKAVLKEEYFLPGGSLETTPFPVIIGRSQTLAKVEQVSEQLPALTQSFLAVAGLSNNTDIIIEENYNLIKNATYSATENADVWNAMAEYFTFKFNANGESNFGQPILFGYAVESVTITGTYPAIPGIKATIIVNLNLFSYIVPDHPISLMQIIELGQS